MREVWPKISMMIIILFLCHVLLEIEVRHGKVGIKKLGNGVVDGGSLRKDLQVVHVEVGGNEINVAVDGSGIDGKIVEVSAKGLSDCNAVNHCKPHNDLVHQEPILYPIEEVLDLVELEVGKRSHGE